MRVTPDGQIIMVPTAPQKRYRSCFSDFFVSENGVISLSLKSLTLVGTLTTTVALFAFLYLACSSGTIECQW